MIRRTLLLLLAIVLGAPADRAEAWGWLEKLSGPGPFVARPLPRINAPIFCFERDWTPHLLTCEGSGTDADEVAGHFNVEISRWVSLENALFGGRADDEEFEVRILQVAPNFMLRVHPVVDVGVGIGFERFSGPAFETFRRAALQPLRVSISPVRAFADNRWSRVLRIDAGVTRIFGEFTADDFCSPGRCNPNLVDRGFRAEGEYLFHYGVVIDLFSAIR
jgi:hypothetical protein